MCLPQYVCTGSNKIDEMLCYLSWYGEGTYGTVAIVLYPKFKDHEHSYHLLGLNRIVEKEHIIYPGFKHTFQGEENMGYINGTDSDCYVIRHKIISVCII